MEAGIFPKIPKVGKITPVYKKGNSQVFDNYRPISMLPIFGKIYEKIVYSRLYSSSMLKIRSHGHLRTSISKKFRYHRLIDLYLLIGSLEQ
jgi:hypothetical protein